MMMNVESELRNLRAAIESQQEEIGALKQVVDTQKRQLDHVKLTVQSLKVFSGGGMGSGGGLSPLLGGGLAAKKQHEEDLSMMNSLRETLDSLCSLLEVEPQSLSPAANACRNSEEKCDYLHRLPVFHTIWSELCNLSNQLRIVAEPTGNALLGIGLGGSGATGVAGPQQPYALAGTPVGVPLSTLGIDMVMPGPKSLHKDGAIINRIVKGSPCHAAGIQPGDMIVAVNGIRTTTPMAVQNTVSRILLEKIEGSQSADTADRADSDTPLLLAIIPAGRQQASPIQVALPRYLNIL